MGTGCGLFLGESLQGWDEVHSWRSKFTLP